MCFGDKALNALGTVYASFILVLIVTAMLITSYQMINNKLSISDKAMRTDLRKLEALSRTPLLDITYINGSLYLVIQAIEPIEVRYLFIDYMNGTIKFIPLDQYVVNLTYIKLPITEYTHPFKVGLIIDPGVTIYYNPMKDPWLISNNIVPNTTYIDQGLVNEIQGITASATSMTIGFNPVFTNNTVIVDSINSSITETKINLSSSPLNIEMKITRLVSPNFTVTYPIIRSRVLESNGVAKLATITVHGYPINIYAIYTTFPSTYLFSVVGILINSSISTNLIFNATIRVQQLMAPTPVALGGYLVRIDNQYLNTPLALSPIANTSINLNGKQYVRQAGLNKITYLTINGTTMGNITSDGIIILGYGRYIKNVWGSLAKITINVDLNITGIELIRWNINPVSISVNSNYVIIRRWRIGVSTLHSDNYAKALYNLLKLTGYYEEEPGLIIKYGRETIYRKISIKASPIYVKTNPTIALKPGISRWILQWQSILKISVITTSTSPFQYQVFRVLGNTGPSSTAIFITFLPDVLILQQYPYPSKETLIVLMPHSYRQISIYAGYTWQYLATTVYTGTTIEINNPVHKAVLVSIIPLQLKDQEHPLTMYYEPEMLGRSPGYFSVLKPGINNVTITLPQGYYLIIPLSLSSCISYIDPMFIRTV